MAKSSPSLKSPSVEQNRVAVGQFERAKQVIEKNDFDYGIKLLLECCKLDPGNLIYRKTLRQTQKAKHKNNKKGGRFSSVTTTPAKLKLQSAFRSEDYKKVLELAETIFVHNPWDVGVQMAMAKAFVKFKLYEGALWCLEQARHSAPKELKVTRELARVYEKVGNFAAAKALWDIVREADPTDEEAWRKNNDLAANETIARGNYESVLQKETEETASLQETKEHGPVKGPVLTPAKSGRADAASLLKQIEKEPQNANHYLELAKYYRRYERWEEAQAALEKGIQVVGPNFELGVELLDLAIQPMRHNLAITDAKLQKTPDDEELQEVRLQLAKEINSRELEIHRKNADRYPTNMSHRLDVGIRLLQANQIDEAIQELQAARTDPRLHWKSLMYLGFCFKVRGNWRLAQRNFEEAIRNMPADKISKRKEILFQLAEGCADNGDISAAVEWGYELANEDFGYKGIGDLLDKWQAKEQVG